MIVCTSRVGEVGVVRQTAVIFSKNVFSARIKCLSICAHPKFCTPIASGVFLNTKNSQVLLTIIGDYRHNSRARFVVVVDRSVENSHFARPMFSISVFPLHIGLSVIETQIQSRHHRAIISALVIFAAIIVLKSRLQR